jgi:putative SOS response-associated peptidase YedK
VRLWDPPPEFFESVPRFNIAPTQKIWTVSESREGPEYKERDWGLIPSWSKEPSGVINARAETLDDRASFADSFEKRRCLIPADGFYEWKKLGKDRQPYYFQLCDESPFFFAGIWDRWHKEGTTITSCALITTTPNELVRSIHDRMPVILQPETYELWLDFRTPTDELKRMLNPYPAEEMKSFPVSNDVNHGNAEHEGLVDPVEAREDPQPSLF